MGRYNFKSAPAQASSDLLQFLVAREQERRQAVLDKFEREAWEAQQADRQRQARLDTTAAEDRQRRIATEERDYRDTQSRQGVLDTGQTPLRIGTAVRRGQWLGCLLSSGR